MFNGKDLMSYLNIKADIQYVHTIADIKANKIDLKSCLNLIEDLH
jgi:hypothetical protein